MLYIEGWLIKRKKILQRIRRSREALRTSWERSIDRRGLGSWDIGSLLYLVYLSNKHGIDPYELLSSFIEVGKKNTVTCGPLKIILRKKGIDHAIFLLTRDLKIVAQMRFSSKVWKNPAKTRRLYSMLVDRAKPFKKLYESPSSIKELQNGMKNVDLSCKVTGKSEVHQVYSRFTGKPLRLCIATVTDPSGSIRLPLWDDQIDSFSVGDEIEIKKAYVTAFRGLLQIVPSRKKGELIIVKPSKPSITKQVIQSSSKRKHQPITFLN